MSEQRPIVALGDSITWGYPNGPTAGWVRRVSDHLGCEIINLGVNGDTLEDLRGRLDRAIDHHPWAVVVSGGTNDASLGRSFDDMAADLVAIGERLDAAGIVTIIGDPPPHGDPHCERDLDSLRHFVNTLAGKRHYRVIPFQRAFLDIEGNLIAERMLDTTHPSLEGYQAMADIAVATGALIPFDRPGG